MTNQEMKEGGIHEIFPQTGPQKLAAETFSIFWPLGIQILNG